MASSEDLKIVLVRHGEPTIKWGQQMTRAEYIRWLAEYENAPLDQEKGARPNPQTLELLSSVDKVFSSPTVRAAQIAQVLAGDRPIAHDAVFIEAPLPAPPIRGLRMDAWGWGIWSRVFWILGITRSTESYLQSRKRAKRAALRLIAGAQRHGSVALVAHGFFNAMIVRELRALGWQGPRVRSWPFWEGNVYKRRASASRRQSGLAGQTATA